MVIYATMCVTPSTRMVQQWSTKFLWTQHTVRDNRSHIYRFSNYTCIYICLQCDERSGLKKFKCNTILWKLHLCRIDRDGAWVHKFGLLFVLFPEYTYVHKVMRSTTEKYPKWQIFVQITWSKSDILFLIFSEYVEKVLTDVVARCSNRVRETVPMAVPAALCANFDRQIREEAIVSHTCRFNKDSASTESE